MRAGRSRIGGIPTLLGPRRLGDGVVTSKEFLDRYGVTLVIVGVFALVLVMLPGNKQVVTTTSAGADAQAAALTPETQTGTLDSASLADTGASTKGKASSVTSAGAGAQAAAGATQDVGNAAGAAVDRALCRSDGRMKGISHYMAPCAGFKTGYAGKNGGATARGVTGSTVKLVLFRSQVDPATTAILTGAKLADSKEDVERIYDALIRYSNLHYQTWGRQIVFQFYDASGKDTNDEAMKADAVRIAQTIKPFGVIGGPKVLGQELVQRGVICVCTVSLSSEFYNAHPPYFFGTLPTITEYSDQHRGVHRQAAAGPKREVGRRRIQPRAALQDQAAKVRSDLHRGAERTGRSRGQAVPRSLRPRAREVRREARGRVGLPLRPRT